MVKTKEFKINVLNSDYCVFVYLCKTGTTIKRDHTTFAFRDNTRGTCYYTTKEYHATILIDNSLPKYQLAGTLAHEATHAIDSIMDYTGINDTEFRGHCVGDIVSVVLKKVIGNK